MQQVRRVLHPKGTVWLVVDDACSSGAREAEDQAHGWGVHPLPAKNADLEPRRSQLGIPQRLTVALLQDGWHLRESITWRKAGGGMESVTTRPVHATETILMLSKTEHPYYDHTGVRLPAQNVTGAKAWAASLVRR